MYSLILFLFFKFIFLLFFCNNYCFSWNYPTLSQARSSLAATSIGNFALFAGGTNGTASSQVDIYNYKSNNWSTSSLSKPRSNLAATSSNILSIALFAGGLMSNYTYSNQIDYYESDLEMWGTTTLSQNFSQLTGSSVKNLFFFAGLVHNKDYSEILSYNFLSHNIINFYDISQFSVSVTINISDIVLINGIDNINGGSPVYIFNATNTQLLNITTLSISRSDLAATSIYNLGIFGGGIIPGNTYSSQIDIYNYSSNSWITGTLSQARSSLAATTVENFAIFAGGQNNNGASSQVDIYNYTSNSWFTNTLSQARYDLAAISIQNIALFAGGTLNSQNNFNVSSKIDIFTICGIGTYINNQSYPKCIPCFEGTYSNIITFSLNNFTTCNQCPLGTYSNITGCSTCIPCPEGTYSNITGSSTCISCPGGTYSNITGAINISTCITCPNKTYSSPGSSFCSPCPLGTYLNQSKVNSSCTPCSKGTYSNITGATNIFTCTPCPKGTYSNKYGSSSCIPCEKGTYSNISGSSSCILCPSGTYSNDGSSICILNSNSNSNSKTVIAIVIPIILIILIVSISLIIFFYLKKKKPIEIDFKKAKLVYNIKIEERLGGGNFGEVYKGIWNGTTKVALKKLKSKEDLKQFVQEASILQTLSHPNIIQFLGIFNSTEQYIVMEYLSKGSLDKVLYIEKDLLKTEDLLFFSKHTAAGMKYLEENKIIHRDLALRNLLVAPGNENEKYIIKISDF